MNKKIHYNDYFQAAVVKLVRDKLKKLTLAIGECTFLGCVHYFVGHRMNGSYILLILKVLSTSEIICTQIMCTLAVLNYIVFTS